MEEKRIKYLLGELTETEKRTLFTELDADEKSKEEFADLANIWGVLLMLPQRQDERIATEGNRRFFKRIEKANTRYFIGRTLRYAAAICLTFLSSWYLAGIYSDRDMENSHTEILVPTGQRMHITLADNTSVWLSPQSRIKFPNRFGRNNRTIELDGEGLFDVAKDKKKPFIVKSKGYNIEVTGTKFNLFSYSKSPRYEVYLIEGGIHIYNEDNKLQDMAMSPDEKVSLVGGQLIKTTSYFEKNGYITSGIYNFQATPFAEILEYLSLWYDVEFEIKDQVLSTNKVSAKFRLTDDIENILTALQNVFRFNFRILNEHLIEISP